MKFKELANKTEAELKTTLSEFISEAESLRMKIRLGETKNYKSMSKLKRDIARVKTRLSELK